FVIEEREACFLERLEIAPNGPRRDVAQGSEIVNGDASAASALDFAEDRPLADDFCIARQELDSNNCRIAGLQEVKKLWDVGIGGLQKCDAFPDTTGDDYPLSGMTCA